MSHAMVNQDVEDMLLDILDQLSTGNLPAGCDAETERLIQAIRLRYPKDEEVQRLCAWFENQTAALGELVDGLVDCLIREDIAE
ncbi:MAG: hypothetical protein JXR29_05180 [Methylothermaceae bacterium]|nr:hypothetical protein [Methylothermaceae bacterium]